MSNLDLLLIAVGLSMDAFAVSVCKGLATKGSTKKTSIVAGAYFGVFQALMPLGGYILGAGIGRFVMSVSKYIALILLALIGLNMIRESLKGESCDAQSASISAAAMIPAAIATSIDAFAVGVSFAMLKVNIIGAVLFIGATTFVLSAAGVQLGRLFGDKLEKHAGVVGGIILIGIGIKIFIAG